jgi:hypothetical protein
MRVWFQTLVNNTYSYKWTDSGSTTLHNIIENNSYIREFLKNKFSSVGIIITEHNNTIFKFHDVADEAFFQLSMLNEEVEI